MKSKLFCKYFMIVFCSGTFLFVPPPAHATSPLPSIFINEVNWAGSALSTADEWIELINPTIEDISMARWKIVGAGANDKNLILPADATIPAQGTYLIANFDWNDSRTALLNEPNLTTSTLSLSNSTLIIEMFDHAGNLIDMAGNAEAPPAGSSGDLKTSMQRIDYALPGYDSNAWADATMSDGLSTDDSGTPGTADLPYILYDDSSDLSYDDNQTATTTMGVDPAYTDNLEDEPIENQATTTTEDSAPPEAGDDYFPDANSVTSTNAQPLGSTQTSTSTQSTTTDAMLETQTAYASATADSLQYANSSSTESNTNAEQLDEQAVLLNQNTLRLNEVMAYPTEGPEWIEIKSAVPNSVINLEGMTMHDATGKILTLNGLLTPEQPLMIFSLTSAKLNNGGDTVYIKNSAGQDIDILIYDSSKKGVSWSLNESGAWLETPTSTPGTINVFPNTTPTKTNITQVADQPTSNQTAVNTTPQPNKTVPAPTAKSTAQTTAQKTTTNTKTSSQTSPSIKTATPVTAKNAVASKTTTATKTQTTTDKNTLTEINFDMLKDSTYGGVRVKLRGLVGTPAQLLTSRAFILLNQDGRGLMVKVPTDRKMPDYGSVLEVIGTLKFDSHDLPYLSVSTKDEWQTLNQERPDIKFHNSALFAPSAEDAWGLVNVTGTILEVKTSSFSILIDEIEVQVKIRPGVNYRAKRLIKEDLVNVTGILDISGETATILPRSADEIQLMSHPVKKEMSATTTPKNGVPGWTPFGAAIGAIGTIEGIKRVRTRFKKIKINA